MKFLTENRFSFVSAALARDSFGVVHFTGTEALSSLYQFTITLVTDQPDIDLAAVLRQPATFTIHRPDDQRVDFNGILSEFEQLHAFNDCIFYRARLRPRLWWLTLTHHNQVCLDMPVVPSAQGAASSSLIGRALIDGGLTTLDFEFRTQKNYQPLEYVCQYDESHYDFFARWLEREGLYYFFEQTPSGEKVVITDSLISHVELPQEGRLIYAPPSGLDSQHHDEVIKTLICRQKMLPKKVLLRDHNYQRPTLEVVGSATVDPRGRGETYVYGDFFLTPEEGNRLAAIHAESLLCRQCQFFGEGTVPFMMPGYTFTLQEHFRRDFNRKYLVCDVSHQGNQTGYLVAGLQGALTDIERTVSYRNSFTAIPAETQFRPQRLTAKPRIAGTLHASIDAEGSGEYAELDDQGRYKVRLPFDINDQHQAGKASCFLRMAQPYAGPKRGMHFPLPKGTEVLLTFIGGDPDRPLIAGAVPNPETPSPTTARNQTESVIQTGGDNTIRIEDKKGMERIILQSPTADSWVRIGAPNDPPAVPNPVSAHLGRWLPDHGIRLFTANDIWREAQERFGEYHCGFNGAAPQGEENGAPKIGTMLNNFATTYKPAGMMSRHGNQAQDWEDILASGHVEVSSLDTIKTQEGNVYDFGGHRSFNLGVRYQEHHIEPTATLNAKQPYDLLDSGGAEFTSMAWPALKDGADASLDGTWPPSLGMWVEKKVGASYAYAKGDAVNVAKGSTLDITHGGRHVEVKFRGDDSLSFWSKSEGGVTNEKKWTKDGTLILETTVDTNSATSSETIYDRNLGTLASYTTKANSGGGLASFSFVMSAKATSDISLGVASAFSLSVAAKVDLELSAAAKLHLELSAAATAKIGIAAALELEMWWNPAGKLKLKNKHFEYHGMGSKLDKREDLIARLGKFVVAKETGLISVRDFKLESSKLKYKMRKLGLRTGIEMAGL